MEAVDTEKGSLPGLVSDGASDGGRRRLYKLSSDGKMAVHYTDGLTTRADGVVCPPFLIKAVGAH